MATLSTIAVHPIKGLQSERLDSIEIAESGRLAYDRKYALFSRDDEYVNGRRNPDIQRIRSSFDLDSETVTLWTDTSAERRRFHLEDDRTDLERWFSDFFDEPMTLERANTNYTDNAGALSRKSITTPGPSIISEATLAEIASWFPDHIDGPEEVRERIRPNLVVEGVPAFWEEKLYADEDNLINFRIGDVALQGLRPLPRCSVPAQDPDSGELLETFVKTFTEKRKETFPEWGDPSLLGDHDELDAGDYYLGVVTRIPPGEWGKELTVGDDVVIGDEQSLITAL